MFTQINEKGVKILTLNRTWTEEELYDEPLATLLFLRSSNNTWTQIWRFLGGQVNGSGGHYSIDGWGRYSTRHLHVIAGGTGELENTKAPPLLTMAVNNMDAARALSSLRTLSLGGATYQYMSYNGQCVSFGGNSAEDRISRSITIIVRFWKGPLSVEPICKNYLRT